MILPHPHALTLIARENAARLLDEAAANAAGRADARRWADARRRPEAPRALSWVSLAYWHVGRWPA